jgi:hypothetical protein
LTRIPTGFILTSRSQFSLIRRFTVTGWSRFTPIRPTAISAVCSDLPDSVHTDPAHGWFSRSFLPTLSLILNNPPQAQLEALRAFGLDPFKLYASSASLSSFLTRRVGPLVSLRALDTCSSIRFCIGLWSSPFLRMSRLLDVLNSG